MEFDYFYGQQAEQFSFYRIPKMLFTDDRFWNVSTDAKLLYGILLDRMNLSARNGWMDAAGRVYIIFTLEETMAALNCGDNKATKLYIMLVASMIPLFIAAPFMLKIEQTAGYYKCTKVQFTRDYTG